MPGTLVANMRLCEVVALLLVFLVGVHATETIDRAYDASSKTNTGAALAAWKAARSVTKTENWESFSVGADPPFAVPVLDATVDEGHTDTSIVSTSYTTDWGSKSLNGACSNTVSPMIFNFNNPISAMAFVIVDAQETLPGGLMSFRCSSVGHGIVSYNIFSSTAARGNINVGFFGWVEDDPSYYCTQVIIRCAGTAADGFRVDEVTVLDQDITPPEITCPAAQTVSAASDQGIALTYSASATDNVAVTTGPSCTGGPASGEVFPIGTTTLTCTAGDAEGLTAQCTVDMVVKRVQTGGGAASTALGATDTQGVSVTVDVPSGVSVAEGDLALTLEVLKGATLDGSGGLYRPSTTAPSGATGYDDWTIQMTSDPSVPSFDKPMKFSLNVSTLSPAPTGDVVLLYYDTTCSCWKDASTTCVPPSSSLANGILTVDVCHFTQFAVFDVGACAFEEDPLSPSAFAVDDRTATFNGQKWVIEMTLPGHWNNIALTSPASCGGGAWTCGGAAVPDASCNRSVTCVLEGWIPEEGCNHTVGPNGEDVYVLAPIFQATVPVETGNSRVLTQTMAVQVTYQTLVNASLSFDSFGDALTDYYISKAAVTGFNENAHMDIEVTTSLSYPFEFTVQDDLDNFADDSTLSNADLDYTVTPAILATTCLDTPGATCTQRLSFQVKSATAQCTLDNTFTLRLTQVCRNADSVDCSLPPGGAVNTTLTLTVSTASVCINNSMSVSLNTSTSILKDYNTGTGVGTEHEAFAAGATVYFRTVVGVDHGQFVQQVKPTECILDGVGAEGSLTRTQKYPVVGTSGGADPAVDHCNTYDSISCAESAPRDHGVVSLLAEPTAWGIPNGVRRTMSISCQYTVKVFGTEGGARRRLLQTGAGAGTTTPTPYVRATFGIGSQQSSSSPAASSSSSAFVISPTVAAAAVLAVAAAVLVIVAVRRRKKRRDKQKNVNTEMITLKKEADAAPGTDAAAPRSSSSTALV